MTVKELITELQKYDEDLRVNILDSNVGYIDITEIFESNVCGRHKLNIT